MERWTGCAENPRFVPVQTAPELRSLAVGEVQVADGVWQGLEAVDPAQCIEYHKNMDHFTTSIPLTGSPVSFFFLKPVIATTR